MRTRIVRNPFADFAAAEPRKKEKKLDVAKAVRGLLVETVPKDTETTIYGRIIDADLANGWVNLELYAPDGADGKLVRTGTRLSKVPIGRLKLSTRKLKFAEGFRGESANLSDNDFVNRMRELRGEAPADHQIDLSRHLDPQQDLKDALRRQADEEMVDLSASDEVSDEDFVERLRAGRRGFGQ